MASAVAPILVGLILPQTGIATVFLMFGAVRLFGALLSVSLHETARRSLEVIVGERFDRVG